MMSNPLTNPPQVQVENGAPAVSAAPDADQLEERQRTDQDFGKLEREARERAAARRLEELKRRMR